MEQQQDMIYGCHAILEALRDAKPIDQILIKKQSDNEQIREIIYLAKKQNVTIKSVPVEKLNKITRKAHQGIIAFMSPIEFQDLEQIVPTIFEQGKNPFIIILDQVCDVRNFGAITRTAECMGVQAIVIPQRGAAKIGADAVKTSAGALLKIPICKVHSLKGAIEYLQQSGITVMCAAEKFSQNCYDADLTKPLALVFGAEENGIEPAIVDMADGCIRIPMQGEIASLNVSAATAMCVYEVCRQRKNE
ncbi:MAG: 23S rRNA (guanosine(2251)-2'-O)-methyltransferase RlmB [Bacteroidales bacterium]|nr:23S rRNA (guanosine(2251)-2'-O)-methyltransferase RlmB [Bacteroidales bacterium]